MSVCNELVDGLRELSCLHVSPMTEWLYLKHLDLYDVHFAIKEHNFHFIPMNWELNCPNIKDIYFIVL